MQFNRRNDQCSGEFYFHRRRQLITIESDSEYSDSPDLDTVEPYMFEPEDALSSTDDSEVDDSHALERLNNTEWYVGLSEQLLTIIICLLPTCT